MQKQGKSADNARIYGVTQIVAGGAILSLFGAAALVSRVWAWFTHRPGTFSLLLLLFGIAAGSYFLWRGIDNLSTAASYRKVRQALGDSKYIRLADLEHMLGWSRGQLVKTLQGQIRRHYWSEACLDAQNSAFMPELSATPYLPVDTGDTKADEMLLGANSRIHDLMALQFTIQDTQVTNLIEQLLVITKQLYGYIHSNPVKARHGNRFSDYYLPTVIQVLKDYQNLESQGVQSSSIRASMQQIREALPAFESAFRQQLDGLYQDKALDISVEIKVMQNTLDDAAFSP